VHILLPWRCNKICVNRGVDECYSLSLSCCPWPQSVLEMPSLILDMRSYLRECVSRMKWYCEGRSGEFNNVNERHKKTSQRNDVCSNIKVINYSISSGHMIVSPHMEYCIRWFCHIYMNIWHDHLTCRISYTINSAHDRPLLRHDHMDVRE
jgi:hypothetical protein